MLKKIFFLAVVIATSINAQEALSLLMPIPQKIKKEKGETFYNPKNVIIENKIIEEAPESTRDEAYQIVVNNGKIKIFASRPIGVVHAERTLNQLAEFGKNRLKNCTITDWPKFKIRGMMLDTGRNFQDLKSIKKQLDFLADYKFNVFHWHLTDNNGWRLESKKYPQLTRADSMDRHAGKFYTQKDFAEILKYAKERNITVIPELDIPGHTKSFRKAFKLKKMNEPHVRKIVTDLIAEVCEITSPEDVPYIHLGTDEVQEHERVPQEWIEDWAKIVFDNNRTLIGWSPGIEIKTKGKQLKQLWRGANDPRANKSIGYIDSQNSYYINHVDPFELLYAASYQQPCRWGKENEKAGAIFAVWHDDAARNATDIIRMNSVLPAIVLFSDNFWRGREKDEPAFYAHLPAIDDTRFEIAKDLERRTIEHRNKFFKNEIFPFLGQTQARWKMTIDGEPVNQILAQSTFYPRHFWFPASAFTKKQNGVAVLKTTIVSEKAQTVNAWIGMNAWSRSDGRSRDGNTPKQGEWNKHGAKILVNGKPIPPPKWNAPNTGGGATKELPLTDEDYAYRKPSTVNLKAGENKIELILPKKNGWKWVGTFAIFAKDSTSDSPRELTNVKYVTDDEISSH